MHGAVSFIFRQGDNSSAEGLGSTPCMYVNNWSKRRGDYCVGLSRQRSMVQASTAAFLFLTVFGLRTYVTVYVICLVYCTSMPFTSKEDMGSWSKWNLTHYKGSNCYRKSADGAPSNFV